MRKGAERYRSTSGAEKLAYVFREAGFAKVVEVGQHFVTKTAVLLEQMGV